MSLLVLALVPYPVEGASARYRAYQLAEPLEAHGIRMRIRPFFDSAAFAALYRHGALATKSWHLARSCARRWADLGGAHHFDLAFVHRDLWPFAGDAALERLAARQPRWVFDFDDAVWLPNVSEANRRFAHLKPTTQYAHLAAGARQVSAGNSWLAGWALEQRRGHGSGGVEVVPTAVDTVRWAPRPRGEGPPRLAWIGSHSTVHYLDPLRPLLPGLFRRHPGLELHVVGARFACEGVRVIEHEWSLEGEVAVTASCDVGLAPLPDDLWARGKCGLKLLLYMSLGLPAVASHAGVHPEMVRDGVTGRLAATPEGFVAALDELLSDPAARQRIGAEARADVVARYSLTAVAPKLARLLHRAAESNA